MGSELVGGISQTPLPQPSMEGEGLGELPQVDQKVEAETGAEEAVRELGGEPRDLTAEELGGEGGPRVERGPGGGVIGRSFPGGEKMELPPGEGYGGGASLDYEDIVAMAEKLGIDPEEYREVLKEEQRAHFEAMERLGMGKPYQYEQIGSMYEELGRRRHKAEVFKVPPATEEGFVELAQRTDYGQCKVLPGFEMWSAAQLVDLKDKPRPKVIAKLNQDGSIELRQLIEPDKDGVIAKYKDSGGKEYSVYVDGSIKDAAGVVLVGHEQVEPGDVLYHWDDPGVQVEYVEDDEFEHGFAVGTPVLGVIGFYREGKLGRKNPVLEDGTIIDARTGEPLVDQQGRERKIIAGDKLYHPIIRRKRKPMVVEKDEQGRLRRVDPRTGKEVKAVLLSKLTVPDLKHEFPVMRVGEDGREKAVAFHWNGTELPQLPRGLWQSLRQGRYWREWMQMMAYLTLVTQSKSAFIQRAEQQYLMMNVDTTPGEFFGAAEAVAETMIQFGQMPAGIAIDQWRSAMPQDHKFLWGVSHLDLRFNGTTTEGKKVNGWIGPWGIERRIEDHADEYITNLKMEPEYEKEGGDETKVDPFHNLRRESVEKQAEVDWRYEDGTPWRFDPDDPATWFVETNIPQLDYQRPYRTRTVFVRVDAQKGYVWKGKGHDLVAVTQGREDVRLWRSLHDKEKLGAVERWLKVEPKGWEKDRERLGLDWESLGFREPPPKYPELVKPQEPPEPQEPVRPTRTAEMSDEEWRVRAEMFVKDERDYPQKREEYEKSYGSYERQLEEDRQKLADFEQAVTVWEEETYKRWEWWEKLGFEKRDPSWDEAKVREWEVTWAGRWEVKDKLPGDISKFNVRWGWGEFTPEQRQAAVKQWRRVWGEGYDWEKEGLDWRSLGFEPEPTKPTASSSQAERDAYNQWETQYKDKWEKRWEEQWDLVEFEKKLVRIDPEVEWERWMGLAEADPEWELNEDTSGKDATEIAIVQISGMFYMAKAALFEYGFVGLHDSPLNDKWERGETRQAHAPLGYAFKYGKHGPLMYPFYAMTGWRDLYSDYFELLLPSFKAEMRHPDRPEKWVNLGGEMLEIERRICSKESVLPSQNENNLAAVAGLMENRILRHSNDDETSTLIQAGLLVPGVQLKGVKGGRRSCEILDKGVLRQLGLEEGTVFDQLAMRRLGIDLQDMAEAKTKFKSLRSKERERLVITPDRIEYLFYEWNLPAEADLPEPPRGEMLGVAWSEIYKAQGGNFDQAWKVYSGEYLKRVTVPEEVWDNYQAEMEKFQTKWNEYEDYYLAQKPELGDKSRKELVDEAVFGRWLPQAYAVTHGYADVVREGDGWEAQSRAEDKVRSNIMELRLYKSKDLRMATYIPLEDIKTFEAYRAKRVFRRAGLPTKFTDQEWARIETELEPVKQRLRWAMVNDGHSDPDGYLEKVVNEGRQLRGIFARFVLEYMDNDFKDFIWDGLQDKDWVSFLKYSLAADGVFKFIELVGGLVKRDIGYLTAKMSHDALRPEGALGMRKAVAAEMQKQTDEIIAKLPEGAERSLFHTPGKQFQFGMELTQMMIRMAGPYRAELAPVMSKDRYGAMQHKWFQSQGGGGGHKYGVAAVLIAGLKAIDCHLDRNEADPKNRNQYVVAGPMNEVIRLVTEVPGGVLDITGKDMDNRRPRTKADLRRFVEAIPDMLATGDMKQEMFELIERGSLCTEDVEPTSEELGKVGAFAAAPERLSRAIQKKAQKRGL